MLVSSTSISLLAQFYLCQMCVSHDAELTSQAWKRTVACPTRRRFCGSSRWLFRGRASFSRVILHWPCRHLQSPNAQSTGVRTRWRQTKFRQLPNLSMSSVPMHACSLQEKQQQQQQHKSRFCTRHDCWAALFQLQFREVLLGRCWVFG